MKATFNIAFKKRRCCLQHGIFFGRVILLAITLNGCKPSSQETTQVPPPAVSVITVTEQAVGSYEEYVARTEAVSTVNLRARVEGTLTIQNTQGAFEGKRVKKGQLLFEVDPKPYLAALKKTEADVASAWAEQTLSGKELERARQLFSKGHISQADLDTRISDKDHATASLKAALANLDTAHLNLSYTDIVAPFDGEVGRIRYSDGALVGPDSEALATLTSVDPIHVYFQIDEKKYTRYLINTHGQEQGNSRDYQLSLRLPDGSLYGPTGVIDFADTHVDATTGTLTARAKFPNPQGVIVPGLYVTLIAQGQEKHNRPLIPQSAVQENQSGRFVLIVNDQHLVEVRPVKMGRRTGPLWEVTEGLKAGEQIIVEGLQKVREGTRITPVAVSIDQESGAVVVKTPTGQKPESRKPSPQKKGA